jgi:hypothetical protein
MAIRLLCLAWRNLWCNNYILCSINASTYPPKINSSYITLHYIPCIQS